jgi:hypothetical protein
MRARNESDEAPQRPRPFLLFGFAKTACRAASVAASPSPLLSPSGVVSCHTTSSGAGLA